MSLEIDDNDTRVTYAGGLWEALRDSSQQYQSTVHSTWDYDASATVTFSGTGITVFATVPAGVGKTVTTFYILDGKTSITKWNDGQNSAQYNQVLYDSGPLSAGSHTLIIKNRGEDNDLDFRLDKLVIQTAQNAAPVTPPTTSSPIAANTVQPVPLQTPNTSHTSSSQEASVASRATTSSSSTLTQSSDSSSITSTPSGSSPRVTNEGVTSMSTGGSLNTPNIGSDTDTSISSKSSLPAILGGVIGFLAFVVFGFIVYILLRRRRRLKERSLLFANVATPFSIGTLPPSERPNIRLTIPVDVSSPSSIPETQHHRTLHLVSPATHTEKSAFHSFVAQSTDSLDTHLSAPYSTNLRNTGSDNPPSYQATL
ncbi:hypothetical protein CPB83DRAFT_444695 [Crepidotus variabilis]|uniref:Uncharacterized protein n=1 Tax=Crepidotus variabilis TaxID=179855 RepID=A0A9P6JNQ5_9AGAR|nr:hypothetical protein CPB83DRAFT_444695 [Crepidotus variabilis]